MMQSTYKQMMEEYNDFDRMILTVKVACHSFDDISEDNPLWHWLRFDVVKSLESCQPMMLHYMDEHDYQKFREFQIRYALPMLEKIIGAWKTMPRSLIGRPEWFLMKKVVDKVFIKYIDLKEH